MVFKSIIGATCTCLAVVSFNADAALHSRLGGQAYYDDVANLTWLADANYAQTSGYDADGSMNQADAIAWAAQLNIGGVTGWRLPAVVQPDLNCQYNTPVYYGYDCTDSDFGSLYYNVLGNSAGGPLTNTAPFSNVFSTGYWTGTDYDGSTAYTFGMHIGSSDYLYSNTNPYNVWAVHDGDVADLQTSIIGSWHFVETPSAGVAGGPIVVTFMENGQYVMGQDGDPAFDPTGGVLIVMMALP